MQKGLYCLLLFFIMTSKLDTGFESLHQFPIDLIFMRSGSLYTLRDFANRSLAKVIPTINTSYSALFLVALKSQHIACTI